MPVVTPFGELSLGDTVALSRWAQAHAAKHQQYVVEHIGPGGGILDEPIDADWMHRHASRHVALATVAQKTPGTQPPPLSSANTKVLALPDIWKTEAELADWHDLHNRLHRLIDAQRQVAGRQAKPNQPHLPGVPPNILPAPPHGPIP